MAKIKEATAKTTSKNDWRVVLAKLGIKSIGVYENGEKIAVRAELETIENAAREYLRGLGKNPL